ncbi:hypothetical protein B7H19_24030 [Pseudomonas putida]|nr:hypothetical protein B7H19_24030 [Pseudomonas putida]
MGFRVPALSRVNPLLQRPAPNLRCVPTPNQCRSGFTREYGSGGNGGLASPGIPTNENAAALFRATASDQPGGQIRRTDDAARWSRCGPDRSK